MDTTNWRLLVADNEEAGCSELANQLEQLGYHVTCVRSAADMMTTLSEGRFDLALVDTNVSDRDPADLVRDLRANGASPGLPVIVVSQEVDTATISRCIELGADDYLVKPVVPALLKARIGVIIERRRLREEYDEDCARAQHLADDIQQFILPVGIELSGEMDFSRLLERIVLRAQEATNADAGTLYLRNPADSLDFAIVITNSLGIRTGTMIDSGAPFGHLPMYREDGSRNLNNVASYVALEGESVRIADAYETDQFDFFATKEFDRKNDYRTRSVLAVPLRDYEDGTIGVLQLINALSYDSGEVKTFDHYQQLLVETLATQAVVALNNQLIMRRQQALLKLEHDIQIGHNIQADFLPKNEEMPDVPGWEIVTCLHPARQVAGDFYDTFAMTHNRIGFLIADVCDKGVGAALFMALMRSLTRAFAQQHYSTDLSSLLSSQPRMKKRSRGSMMLPSAGSLGLEKAVKLTNDYVANNHGALAMFATMFFGVLNPDTGSVLYINGGHNAPYVIDSQGQIKEKLTPSGPAVGMFADADFEIRETQLDPGDILVSFTDGVPDARNEAGEMFGDPRLLELIAKPAADGQDLLKRIESNVFDFIATAEQFDDVTVLIVRRDPDAKSGPQIQDLTSLL